MTKAEATALANETRAKFITPEEWKIHTYKCRAGYAFTIYCDPIVIHYHPSKSPYWKIDYDLKMWVTADCLNVALNLMLYKLDKGILNLIQGQKKIIDTNVELIPLEP